MKAAFFPKEGGFYLGLDTLKAKHIEKNKRGKSSKYLFFSKTH